MNKILSMVAIMALSSMAVSAAGTTSGTDITNTATLNFSVGSVAQTAITSNTDTFKVDKKIDFLVSHTDGTTTVDIVGKQLDVERTFTLANESNEAQKFQIAVSNLSGNTYDNADTADMLNLEINVNGAGWVTGPVTLPTALAVDTNITILVRGDVADDAVDGSVMNIQLEAIAFKADGSAAETNTAGADVQGTVETVLGEGVAGAGSDFNFNNTGFDGKYSAWGGYIVKSPNLSMTKLSCVWKDEVNTDLTLSKRIPGATLVYVFDLNNTGTLTDATGITLTDTLSTEFDISGTVASAKVKTGVSSACSCTNGDETGGNTLTTSATASLSNEDLTITDLSVTKSSHTCVSINVVLN